MYGREDQTGARDWARADYAAALERKKLMMDVNGWMAGCPAGAKQARPSAQKEKLAPGCKRCTKVQSAAVSPQEATRHDARS